jgi:hypothetical protein
MLIVTCIRRKDSGKRSISKFYLYYFLGIKDKSARCLPTLFYFNESMIRSRLVPVEMHFMRRVF